MLNASSATTATNHNGLNTVPSSSSTSNNNGTLSSLTKAKSTTKAAAAFLDPDEIDYLTTNLKESSVTNHNSSTTRPVGTSTNVTSQIPTSSSSTSATAALLKTPVTLRQQEKSSLFGAEDSELDIGGGDIFVPSSQHNGASESALIVDDELGGESGWEL